MLPDMGPTRASCCPGADAEVDLIVQHVFTARELTSGSNRDELGIWLGELISSRLHVAGEPWRIRRTRMWRYESLVLLYALSGLAVWTWIIRNHHRRARQRARGAKALRRRQRIVERLGFCSIGLVALLAVVTGFVDPSGLALVLALLVATIQLLVVFAFQNSRYETAPLR